MTLTVHQPAFDISVTFPARGRLRSVNPLEYAAAWWSAEDCTGTQIPSRVQGAPPLVFQEGESGMPVHYPHTGRPYFGLPGWDDMWLSAPFACPPAGFELRFDHDQDFGHRYDPEDTPEWFAVAHQGTDGDFGWAVLRDYATGAVSVVWSPDGDQIVTVPGGTPSFGRRRGHVAVRFDAAAGTLDVFEQAAGQSITRPLSHGSWSRVGERQTFTPGAAHQSASPLSVSGFSTLDETVLAALGAYHRLSVSSLDGVRLVDLDPATVGLLGPWAEVDGYPDVGGVTTANEARFGGGAGETWTAHVFQTYSYPVALVDRPVVQLGNGSFLRAAHHPAFDAEDLTVVVCYRRFHGQEVSENALIVSHSDTDPTSPDFEADDTGWQVGFAEGDMAMTAGAGGPFTQTDTSAVVARGVWRVTAGRRRGQRLSVFNAGVVSAPGDVGPDFDWSVDAPLDIGGGTENPSRNPSLDFCGAAVFDRALTDLELHTVAAEMLE